MQYFKPLDEKQYSWSLFFLMNGLSYDKESARYVEEDVGLGITVKRQIACGKGVNISEETKRLSACQQIRVFTKEIELALIINDEVLYLYQNMDPSLPVQINNIDVAGSYVYVSEKDVCSPVLYNETFSNNNYFKNLKEYILTGKTETDMFIMEYDADKQVFSIRLKNSSDDQEGAELILECTNIGVRITYPFVFYILRYLKRDTGFAENYRITKVEKRK